MGCRLSPRAHRGNTSLTESDKGRFSAISQDPLGEPRACSRTSKRNLNTRRRGISLIGYLSPLSCILSTRREVSPKSTALPRPAFELHGDKSQCQRLKSPLGPELRQELNIRPCSRLPGPTVLFDAIIFPRHSHQECLTRLSQSGKKLPA